ncbi:hypothetical protein AAAU82_04060 [Lachnospira eligens]|uniref:hypothetical protein n=1 Tax=Lachnospira eligens TaxID=39485 RepID=UPI0032C106F3
MKSYFKRFIVVCFTLIIIFVNISSFYYVAYADNQSSGGHFGSNTDLTPFNKLYDGFDFSDTIAKHESFYFSDSVGNKHAVARVGSAWICLFGSRATFNGTQDEQLNYYLSYYAYTGYKSIANSFSAFMASKLGSLTKGGYTLVENALSSNISTVANGISYSESDDSISIDSNSIDKLREEIKKYYYNSIGLKEKKSSGTVSSIIDSSDFRACFEYEEDYINAFGYKNYNYCLKTYYGFYYFFNDLSDYIYVSNDSNNDRFLSSYDNWTKETWRFRTLKTDGTTGYFQPVKENTVIRYDFTLKVNVSDMYFWYTPSNGDWVLRPDWNNDYSKWVSFYSKDNSSLKFWASYSALYNYLHGDQNAYLSSTIEKTGEDITFSIKDMNENLGNKMDALIDSINSNKSNMSADELQNAIDKGLEDLNKNTEDIKDNTSDILDVLREQNQILLDILGVTTNIYKVVKDSDSKEKTYNINYVQSVFNSMFKGLKNAVLYGENTVRDDVSEDTDDIDSIVSDIPPDKKNYHNGLFGRFPFSVPYQLFDWLQALYVDPVAPKFTLSYAYLFEDLGYETNNFKFIIDLGDEKYSKWIELVRSGEKLSFIIYMAIATYHRFKNEI